MDLLITKTGLGAEKNGVDFKNQVLEEVTFDRCFYIYGGPQQLEIQQLFSFADEMSGSKAEFDKGKKIDIKTEGNDDDMKNLHNSSVTRAADMAASGLVTGLNLFTQKEFMCEEFSLLISLKILKIIHCTTTITHLVILGKSIISHANKVQDEDTEALRIEWPEDPTEKGKLIRGKVESMVGYVEAVSNSFITGISDVSETYAAASKGVAADSKDIPDGY
ncbi:hypothetical protein AALP_AA6G359300 [Arabis alpina]|uniref:DUF7798 domain-containing protein n=1 Tax=Arabis alpina TaxID=50452 RepID=A0A087GTW4_ARAAL|nr:hypothetical protein AALP_AA6G359300 [Arabis alpina]